MSQKCPCQKKKKQTHITYVWLYVFNVYIYICDCIYIYVCDYIYIIYIYMSICFGGARGDDARSSRACCPSSGDLTIHQWAACWDHCPCRTNLCVYHSISTLVYIHLYPDICLYTIWHRMYFSEILKQSIYQKSGKKTWTAKCRLAVSETRF